MRSEEPVCPENKTVARVLIRIANRVERQDVSHNSRNIAGLTVISGLTAFPLPSQ